jgi:hypothetical protein
LNGTVDIISCCPDTESQNCAAHYKTEIRHVEPPIYRPELVFYLLDN